MSPRSASPLGAALLASLLSVSLPDALFAAEEKVAPGPAPRTRADAHADPLPPGARLRLGTVRWRASARFLAFMPDGKTLVTGDDAPGGGGAVRFWDTATGKENGSFRLPSYITAFALAPDGKTLALSCGYESLGIVLVTAPDGKEIQRIDKHPVDEPLVFFQRLEFSPDGKTLAGVSMDGGLRLYNLETGKTIVDFKGNHVGGYSVWISPIQTAFSPDGKKLAYAGEDETLRIVEIAAEKELFKRKIRRDGPSRPVSVSFSPDGKKLAWIGEDAGTVALWDVATGEPVVQLRGSPDTVTAVLFSPDGKRVAAACSAGEGGSIHLWDAEAGKEIRKFAAPAGEAIASVVFSPDGKQLAFTAFLGEVVHLCDVDTGKELSRVGEHQGDVCSVAFSPDGRTALTGCADGVIRLWDADKGTVARRIEVGGGDGNPYRREVDFSDDRKAAAVSGFHTKAELWDLDLGKSRAQLDVGKDEAVEIVFAPDGKTLATRGAAGGGVQLWNARDGKKADRSDMDKNYTGSFAFAPHGNTLVTRHDILKDSYSYEISIWDVGLGKELRKWSAPNLVPYNVGPRFSPDGRTIATAGSRVMEEGMADGKGGKPYSRQVDLWDAETGMKRHTLVAPNNSRTNEYLTCYAFSPDGKTLAAGGQLGVIYLWEVSTARMRAVLTGHRYEVTSLDFSPDGARLISGSNDTTALIWDLTGLAVEGKPSKALTAEDLSTLWKELADEDAGKANRAGWRLAFDPEASVPFLRKQMRAVEVTVNQIAKMLADLDSDDFDERETATERLANLGDLAGPALRQALEGELSTEARNRVKKLMHKLDDTVVAPEEARALRVVEVLEHIGSADARKLLDTLSQGAAARLTQDAKAAAARLADAASRPSNP